MKELYFYFVEGFWVQIQPIKVNSLCLEWQDFMVMGGYKIHCLDINQKYYAGKGNPREGTYHNSLL